MSRISMFSKLEIFTAEPLSWRLRYRGRSIILPRSADLRNYRRLRCRVLEQLGVYLPAKTRKLWKKELKVLFADANNLAILKRANERGYHARKKARPTRNGIGRTQKQTCQ